MTQDQIIEALKKIAEENPGTGRRNAALMTMRTIHAAMRINAPEIIDWNGIIEQYGLRNNDPVLRGKD